VLRRYVDDMARKVGRTLNRRKPSASTTEPPSTPTTGMLAKPADADDLPEDFRKALDDATKD
jgi:hypothetical protein